MSGLIVRGASCLGACGELQLAVRWRTGSDEAYPRHHHSNGHLGADGNAVPRTAESSLVKTQCVVRSEYDVVAARQCSACGEG